MGGGLDAALTTGSALWIVPLVATAGAVLGRRRQRVPLRTPADRARPERCVRPRAPPRRARPRHPGHRGRGTLGLAAAALRIARHAGEQRRHPGRPDRRRRPRARARRDRPHRTGAVPAHRDARRTLDAIARGSRASWRLARCRGACSWSPRRSSSSRSRARTSCSQPAYATTWSDSFSQTSELRAGAPAARRRRVHPGSRAG